MKKLNIAFDLDGTCVDVHSQFAEILARWTGKDTYNVTQFEFHKELGIDNKTLWEAIEKAYSMWETTPLYPGVRELMKCLHYISHDAIYFVTARPKRFANETYGVIERFCPYPFKVAMCTLGEHKYKYLADYDYYVEDRRQTAIDLANRGWKVFLPRRTYNSMPASHANITPLAYGVQSLVNMVEKFTREVPWNTQR
jgi:phosphoglycolate phosphatase-like HAD superfamily hydrolase